MSDVFLCFHLKKSLEKNTDRTTYIYALCVKFLVWLCCWDKHTSVSLPCHGHKRQCHSHLSHFKCTSMPSNIPDMGQGGGGGGGDTWIILELCVSFEQYLTKARPLPWIQSLCQAQSADFRMFSCGLKNPPLEIEIFNAFQAHWKLNYKS